MTDIILPAYDTPTNELTPIVLDALRKGAVARPHDTDPSLIVISITADKAAKAFQTAVDAILKPGE